MTEQNHCTVQLSHKFMSTTVYCMNCSTSFVIFDEYIEHVVAACMTVKRRYDFEPMIDASNRSNLSNLSFQVDHQNYHSRKESDF